jgi:hypothetical protein
LSRSRDGAFAAPKLDRLRRHAVAASQLDRWSIRTKNESDLPTRKLAKAVPSGTALGNAVGSIVGMSALEKMIRAAAATNVATMENIKPIGNAAELENIQDVMGAHEASATPDLHIAISIGCTGNDPATGFAVDGDALHHLTDQGVRDLEGQVGKEHEGIA